MPRTREITFGVPEDDPALLDHGATVLVPLEQKKGLGYLEGLQLLRRRDRLRGLQAAFGYNGARHYAQAVTRRKQGLRPNREKNTNRAHGGFVSLGIVRAERTQWESMIFI